MSDQKIDLSKFSVKSLVVGKKQDIWKALRYGIIFTIILGLGYLVYRGAEALFPKPQKLEQNIVAQKGSTVNIKQVTANKRFLIPFVEGGVEARDNQDVGAFIRAGARIEF
jgi:hypothetical protein